MDEKWTSNRQDIDKKWTRKWSEIDWNSLKLAILFGKLSKIDPEIASASFTNISQAWLENGSWQESFGGGFDNFLRDPKCLFGCFSGLFQFSILQKEMQHFQNSKEILIWHENLIKLESIFCINTTRNCILSLWALFSASYLISIETTCVHFRRSSYKIFCCLPAK